MDTQNPQNNSGLKSSHYITLAAVLLVLAGLALGAMWLKEKTVSKEVKQVPLIAEEKESETVIPEQKTYSNEKFGFQFDYPGKIFITDELVLQPNGQLDFSDYIKNLNVGLPQNSKMLFVDITEFSKLPKTIKDACDEAVSQGADPCEGMRSVSQQEVLADVQQLNKTTLNSVVESSDYHYSTIVSVGGKRGILSVDKNAQSVGYTKSLVVYDKNNNMINISLDMGHEGDDINTVRQSQENDSLSLMISTFKFNN